MKKNKKLPTEGTSDSKNNINRNQTIKKQK